MAKITVQKKGIHRVLTIEPTNQEEGQIFDEFCRPRDKLQATMYENPGYTYPTLEVKKEII